MTNEVARVWIGKVTFKANNVTVLRPRVPNGRLGTTGTFIETLVKMLHRARMGDVLGYAMVFDIVDNAGRVSTIECADVAQLDGTDRLTMLGSIRTMEHNFMLRSGLLDGEDFKPAPPE